MNGRRITTDPDAPSSDPSLPAFLSKPAGSPVYHGFVVIPETCTEGWCLGSITEFEDPAGCTSGDAFVIAPDGGRAGLVWGVGGEPLHEILAPGCERRSERTGAIRCIRGCASASPKWRTRSGTLARGVIT